MTVQEPHDLVAPLVAMLERVRRHLRPVTAADIAARLDSFRDRAEELRRRARPAPPPVVTRPGHLPQPLNPFYFARRRPP